jgi:hypothetical protein
MNPAAETSPEQDQRGRAIWDELVEQYRSGPLPFVRINPTNPGTISKFWDVADSGNESDDLAHGCFYAELLVHCAKNWRDRGNLSIDPFRIISAVLEAIVMKGNVGAIERAFLGRIAILALAASLN